MAGSKHKYAAEIVTQMMFSTGAYLIEHPGTDPESVEAYGAGVEGALRAYEAILKAKPKLRDTFLDDLLAKRDAGGLATFVSQTIPKCKP